MISGDQDVLLGLKRPFMIPLGPSWDEHLIFSHTWGFGIFLTCGHGPNGPPSDGSDGFLSSGWLSSSFCGGPRALG